jgi:hypothetical protein
VNDIDAGVEFPAASVLQHATAVSETSDRMAQAKSAVREVTMDGQASFCRCE